MPNRFSPPPILERRAIPIQDKVAANSSSNSKAASLDSTPVAGNVLLLCSSIAGNNTITSITQTNVTWTQLLGTSGLTPTVELWKGVVSASPGTSITVAYSGTNFNCWWAGEFAGLAGTVDQSSVSGATVTHWRTGAITPSADSLVIATMGTSNGATPFDVAAFGGGVMATPPAILPSTDNQAVIGTLNVACYRTALTTNGLFARASGNHTSVIASIV